MHLRTEPGNSASGGWIWTIAKLACFAAAIWQSTAAAQTAEMAAPLRVGILPTNSAPVILRMYQPMRSFLEGELKREVLIETGTSYRAFYDDTRHGVFDLVITAPHLARLHQIDTGLRPLAMNASRTRTVVVVRNDSNVHDARRLRGQVVALHDAASISVIQGVAWLQKAGLQAGRDYYTTQFPTQTSTLLAVVEGRAAAAFLNSTGLAQLSEPARGKLRVLKGIDTLPGLMYLAGPQVAQADQHALARALLKFPGSEPLWSQFAAASGYGGITAVRLTQLRKMDAFLPATRQALTAGDDRPPPGTL
jgi:phosphonate transport system substrate-binding protein